MFHKLKPYLNGKQMKQNYLETQGLAPLHPNNLKQYLETPWTLTDLQDHLHGKTLTKLLEKHRGS